MATESTLAMTQQNMMKKLVEQQHALTPKGRILGKYILDNPRKAVFMTTKELAETCGVSEAVMAAVLALTDPGDEVIIFEPWYENYVPDCYMAGVKPVFIEQEVPGYQIDFDRLESLINRRTRLLIINTPQNPNGKVFSKEDSA